MGSWSLDVASDKHYAWGQVCLPSLFRGLWIGIPSLQAEQDYLVDGMFTNAWFTGQIKGMMNIISFILQWTICTVTGYWSILKINKSNEMRKKDCNGFKWASVATLWTWRGCRSEWELLWQMCPLQWIHSTFCYLIVLHNSPKNTDIQELFLKPQIHNICSQQI